MTLKAAVIGLGRIGAQWQTEKLRAQPSTHLGSWLATSGVEVVAVCDINARTSMTIGEKYGIPPWADYWDMLDKHPDLDIISVATPADTHYQIVRHIANAKAAKLIFCEKPIATSIVGATGMINLCKENGIKLAVNHTRRWEPIWQKMAALMQTYGSKSDSTEAHFTGDIMNVGIHLADLLNWYQIPKEQVVVQNYRSLGYLLFELDVLFVGGRVRMSDNGGLLEEFESKPSYRYDGINELLRKDWWKPTTFTTDTPMELACWQLRNCLAKGETPCCTGEDGLKALELVESWKK